MPYDAGDIESSLTLDRDPFNEGLEQAKRAALDFQNQKFSATLDADSEPLDAELEEAQADLDELDGTRAEPELGLDAEDFDEVESDASERLEALDTDRAEPEVGLEDEDFDADYEEVRARLDELDTDRAEPTVGLDDEDLNAKLAEIYAALDVLRTDGANLKVNLDDKDALAKLAAIQAAGRAIGQELDNGQDDAGRVDQLAGDVGNLDGELRQLGEEAENAANEVDQLGSSAGGAGGKIDELKTASADAGDGFGGLMGTVTMLLPALVDVGVVGAAGIGGLVTAAATAGVGLGAFALAAEGDLKSVEAQAKEMLATFQQQNASTVLPAVQAALPVISGLFNDLHPLVAGAAAAIGQFETSASTALNAPFWHSFFDFLGGQANGAITTFGRVIAGLGTALAGLDRAFAPVMVDMEQHFDALAVTLTHFGETAGTNSGLHQFIEYLISEAPRVGSTLESVGGALLDVGEDAARVGNAMLPIIRTVADLVQAAQSIGPVFIEAGLAVYTLNKALAPLGGTLNILKDVGNLGNLFNGIGDSGAASKLGNIAIAAGQADRGMMNAAAGALNAKLGITGAAEAAEDATPEVAGIGEAMGGILGPAGIAVGAMAAVTFGLVKLIDDAPKTTAALNNLNGVINDIEYSGDPYSQQIAGLTKLQAKIKSTVPTGIAFAEMELGAAQNGQILVGANAKATDQYALLNKEQSAVSGGLDKVRSKQSEATESTNLLKTSTTQATSAASTYMLSLERLYATAGSPGTLETLATAMKNVNTSVSAASTALSDFTDALNINGGNTLTATSAYTSAQSALQGFATSVKGTTLNMSSLTPTQVAAQQSAEQFASTLYTLTESSLAAGKSAESVASTNRTLVSSFDATALGAHAPKTAVDALNKSLGLVPLTRSTTLKQDGAQQVTQAAQAEKKALDALHGTWTSHISQVGAAGVQAEAAAVHQALMQDTGTYSSTITTTHDNVTNNTTNNTTSSRVIGPPNPNTSASATALSGLNFSPAGMTAAGITGRLIDPRWHPTFPGDDITISGSGAAEYAAIEKRLEKAIASINAEVAAAEAAYKSATTSAGRDAANATKKELDAKLAALKKELSAIQADAQARAQAIQQTTTGLEGSSSGIIITPNTTVSGAGPAHPGGTQKNPTAIGQLHQQLEQMEQFGNLLRRLRKLGLNQQLITELVTAFQSDPADALATAKQIVAGGEKLVREINEVQGEIDREARRIAREAEPVTKIKGKVVGVSLLAGMVEGIEAGSGGVQTAYGKLLASLEVAAKQSGVGEGDLLRAATVARESNANSIVHQYFTIEGSSLTVSSPQVTASDVQRIALQVSDRQMEHLYRVTSQTFGRGHP